MTLEVARARLVAALLDVARQHGLPNGTTPGELEAVYGVPRMLAGRLGQYYGRWIDLELQKHGIRGRYGHRRFYLSAVEGAATP